MKLFTNLLFLYKHNLYDLHRLTQFLINSPDRISEMIILCRFSKLRHNIATQSLPSLYHSLGSLEPWGLMSENDHTGCTRQMTMITAMSCNNEIIGIYLCWKLEDIYIEREQEMKTQREREIERNREK